MKFYKDKDTALDEIQSKSKQNQLGIPVDDLRGTLNNISKETNLQNSSFGIPTEQQRPSNVYLDESRVSFIEDEEEKPVENIETTNDNQNFSIQKTNEQPSSKDLKIYSDEFKLKLFEKKEKAYENYKKNNFNSIKKLDGNTFIPGISKPQSQNVIENENDGGLINDFKDIGFDNLSQRLKGFAISYGFMDDDDQIKDTNKDFLRLQKEIQNSYGGKLIEEVYDIYDNNDGFFNISKKIAQAVVTDPKGVGSALLQELPTSFAISGTTVAATKGAALVTAGATIPALPALIVGTATLGTLFAGYKVIEQGSRILAYTDDGLTDAEIEKAKRDANEKSAWMTAVDFITLGVASKFLSGNIYRSSNNTLREGLSKNNVNVSNLGNDLRNEYVSLVQKSPKGTTRDQFIKNYSTAVEKTLKKNKVSPDVFKQVATNVEDTIKKQAALLPLVNSKNVLNFATQTIGEGTGELVGEYAVTGELDVPGAIIESIVATPASMADVIITNVYSEVQDSQQFKVPKATTISDAMADPSIESVKKDSLKPDVGVEPEETVPQEKIVNEKKDSVVLKESTVNEILKEDISPQYIAPIIDYSSQRKDMSVEDKNIIVDSLYKMVDNYDNKQKDNSLKIRSKIEDILNDDNKINEASKTYLQIKTEINQKLNKDGQIKNSVNKKLTDNFAQSLINYAVDKYAGRTSPIQKDYTKDVSKSTNRVNLNVKNDTEVIKVRNPNPIRIVKNENKNNKTEEQFRITSDKVESFLKPVKDEDGNIKKDDAGNVINETFAVQSIGDNRVVFTDALKEYKKEIANLMGEKNSNDVMVYPARSLTKSQDALRKAFKEAFDTNIIYVQDSPMEISRPDQYTARLNVTQDNKGFVSKNKKDNPVRIRGSAVVKDNKNFIFLNLNELPDFQTESVVLGHELAHILQDKKYEDIYKPLRKVIDVNFKKYFREEMSNKIELKIAETYPNLSKEEKENLADKEKFAIMVGNQAAQPYFWEGIFTDVSAILDDETKSNLGTDRKNVISFEKWKDAFVKLIRSITSFFSDKYKKAFNKSLSDAVQKSFTDLSAREIALRSTTNAILSAKHQMDKELSALQNPLNKTISQSDTTEDIYENTKLRESAENHNVKKLVSDEDGEYYIVGTVSEIAAAQSKDVKDISDKTYKRFENVQTRKQGQSKPERTTTYNPLYAQLEETINTDVHYIDRSNFPLGLNVDDVLSETNRAIAQAEDLDRYVEFTNSLNALEQSDYIPLNLEKDTINASKNLYRKLSKFIENKKQLLKDRYNIPEDLVDRRLGRVLDEVNQGLDFFENQSPKLIAFSEAGVINETEYARAVKNLDEVLDATIDDVTEADQTITYDKDFIVNLFRDKENIDPKILKKELITLIKEKKYSFNQIKDIINDIRYKDFDSVKDKKIIDNINNIRSTISQNLYLYRTKSLIDYIGENLQTVGDRTALKLNWLDSVQNSILKDGSNPMLYLTDDYEIQEFKKYQKARSNILNRRLKKEGVTFRERFGELLFARYNLETLKKVDSVPNEQLESTLSNLPKNKIEELAILKRNEGELVKRYFDDVAFATLKDPNFSQVLFKDTLSGDAILNPDEVKEFRDYLKRKLSLKEKQVNNLPVKTVYQEMSKLANMPEMLMLDNNTREQVIVEKLKVRELTESLMIVNDFPYDKAYSRAIEIAMQNDQNVSISVEEIKNVFAKINTSKQAIKQKNKLVNSDAISHATSIDQMFNKPKAGDDSASTESEIEKNLKFLEDMSLEKTSKDDIIDYRNARNFRLKRGNKHSGMFSVLYVEKYVNTLLPDFQSKYNVNVVKDIYSLPKKLSNELIKDGKNPKGVYDNTTAQVYLLADNLESVRDIEVTLFHELYGHYGLRQLFGKELDSFLNAQYKTNSKLKKLTDKFIKDNDLSPNQRLEAIEEIIADEIALNNSGTFVAKLINKVIQLLRNINLNSVADYLQKKLPEQIVYELAKLKAVDGKINFEVGEKYDIRYSDPKDGKRINQSKILKDLINKDDKYVFEYLNNLFPEDEAQLRKLKNAANNLTYHEYLKRKFQKAGTDKPIFANRLLTTLPRDTKEDKEVIRMSARRSGKTFDALYFYPTDTWYIVNDGEFVTKFDNYNDTFDYLEKLAGKGRVKQRTQTPYTTFNPSINFAKELNLTQKELDKDYYSITNAYFKYVNQFAPLKLLIDTARKKNKNKQNELVMDDLEREMILNESSTGAKLEGLKNNYVAPIFNLIEDLKKFNVTLKDVEEFFHAETAQERNKVIRKINPRAQDAGSGMTDATARKLLKEYKTKEYYPVLEKISKLLDKMSSEKIDYMYQNDLISFFERKKLKTAYKHYRNLSSVNEKLDKLDDQLKTIEYRDRSPVYSSKGIKRALGREGGNDKEVNNIVINTILGYESAIVAGSKNKFKNKVLAFFESFYDEGIVGIEELPNPERKINEDDGYVSYVIPEEQRQEKDVVFARVNGIPYKMKINTSNTEHQKDYLLALYELLGGQRERSTNLLTGFARLSAPITRAIGSMATTYNPTFPIINGFRDGQTAIANMISDPNISKKNVRDAQQNYVKGIKAAIIYLHKRAKGQVKVGLGLRRKADQVISESIDKIIKTSVGLKKYLSEKDAKDLGFFLENYKDHKFDKEIESTLDDFTLQGGLTFYMDRINSDTQLTEIAEFLGIKRESMIKKFGNTSIDALRGLGAVVENMSVLFEIAPRFAVYEALKKEKGKREAAVYAKELTTNFNQRGYDLVPRQLFIFFNPAVQGTIRFLRDSGITNKFSGKYNIGKKASKGFQILFGIGFTAGFISNILGRAFGEDDDDEAVPAYDRISDYKKTTSLTFYPEQLGGSIPLAYGWNIPFAMGNIVADMMVGGTTALKGLEKSIYAVLESTLPVSGLSDKKGSGDKLIYTIMPTVAKPFFDLYTNENRFGSPIIKEDVAFLTQTPNSWKSFASVNPVIDSFAKKMNEISGGSQFIPGKVDLAGGQLEYLFYSYLPGLPTNALRFVNKELADLKGIYRGKYARDVNPISIVERFKAYPQSGFYVGAFKRLEEKIKPMIQEVKFDGNPELIERYSTYIASYDYVEKRALNKLRPYKTLRNKLALIPKKTRMQGDIDPLVEITNLIKKTEEIIQEDFVDSIYRIAKTNNDKEMLQVIKGD